MAAVVVARAFRCTRMCLPSCFVQAYVRKAKAMHSAGNYAGAQTAIADALAVRPANKEVNRRDNSPRLLAEGAAGKRRNVLSSVRLIHLVTSIFRCSP